MLAAIVAALVLAGLIAPSPANAISFGRGIWLSQAEIQALPTSGAAWTAVKSAADGSWGTPTLADPLSNADAYTLAGALVYARTGIESYRTRVIAALRAIVGTESGSSDSMLSVGRNLVSYVIAADLVGFSDAAWSSWLSALRTKRVVSGRGESLVGCHEQRANNHGTNCGASRIAADVYLNDVGDLARAVQVFRGWLGDRSMYTGFNLGELWWQADPANPVGINKKGATIQGRNVDGVLPDDQRRGGSFTWPAPQEDYVWGALGPAVVQAELLYRAGYGTAYSWSDAALKRAVTWLYTINGFPAGGDNKWVTWLANFAYGTSFATSAKTLGKSMAWTDWTHARTRGSTSSTPTPTPTPTPSLTTDPPPTTGAGTTFAASADAQVKSTSPNENFGTLGDLRVRSDAGGGAAFRTYVTFTVSGLSTTIGSAKLRLYVTDESSDGGTVFAVPATWSESTLSWSTAPAPTGQALGGLGVAAAGTWVEVDVSAVVKANGTFSFAIVSTSTNSTIYSSREGGKPPVLVLS